MNESLSLLVPRYLLPVPCHSFNCSPILCRKLDRQLPTLDDRKNVILSIKQRSSSAFLLQDRTLINKSNGSVGTVAGKCITTSV